MGLDGCSSVVLACCCLVWPRLHKMFRDYTPTCLLFAPRSIGKLPTQTTYLIQLCPKSPHPALSIDPVQLTKSTHD